MSRQVTYYDNYTIQVYAGKLGWAWTRNNPDGTTSGDVGYATKEAALAAARS